MIATVLLFAIAGMSLDTLTGVVEGVVAD